MPRGPQGQIKKKPRNKIRPSSKAPDSDQVKLAPSEQPLVAWPIVGCQINENWQQQGMASIWLLKQNPVWDDYTFAGFLVDVAGLGLKDAFVRPHVSRRYLTQAMTKMKEHGFEAGFGEPPTYGPCSHDLMRQLVFGSLLWANQHGFRTPSQVLATTEQVLGLAALDELLDLSVFGRDGKPFIVGPLENVARFLPMDNKGK